GRRGHHLEALGQFGDAVAVAHPDRVLAAHLPEALVEPARRVDLDVGAAELARMPPLDLAAELQAQRLLAVADGKDGHAGIYDLPRRARTALVRHRGRPAREDHALGSHGPERLGGVLERVQLAI